MTHKWLKSDPQGPTLEWPQVTQKWLKHGVQICFRAYLRSLWGRSTRASFESLLGHFDSFCVSVELGACPLHKTRLLNWSRLRSSRCSEIDSQGASRSDSRMRMPKIERSQSCSTHEETFSLRDINRGVGRPPDLLYPLPTKRFLNWFQNNFGSVIPPPKLVNFKLPKIISKTFWKGRPRDLEIRLLSKITKTDYIQILFGNSRTGTIENNSKLL